LIAVLAQQTESCKQQKGNCAHNVRPGARPRARISTEKEKAREELSGVREREVNLRVRLEEQARTGPQRIPARCAHRTGHARRTPQIAPEAQEHARQLEEASRGWAP